MSVFAAVDSRVVKRLWLLLIVAAAARLLMQMAALPPYAGLDEAYHAARIAFVVAEGRNPTADEPSIPPYIVRSLAGESGRPAAFATLSGDWPQRVRRGVLHDRVLTPDDLRPYVVPNYEAQHPSLYYTLAAQAVKLLPVRTQLGELRAWRWISLFFAMVTVIAVASIGVRVGGAAGLVAAALLVAIPTWMTLVMRASNDALACAAIAVAFAISFGARTSRGAVFLEAVAWAFALAVKLYSWPAAVGVFVLWWVQKTPWSRRLAVMSAGAAAIALTLFEFAQRTRNPLGLFMFDPGADARSMSLAAIDWAAMAKVTIASFAWTSGQHANALRPLAIALYLAPLAIVFALTLVRNVRPYRGLVVVCFASAVAFAIAQLANAMAYSRTLEGALPAGGKEGWYWYTLAPLWFGIIVAIVIRHLPTKLVVAVVAWIVLWDIAITEGALFLDYAGVATAAAGDAIFRWGPRRIPFVTSMAGVGVGPWSEYLGLMRVIQLVILASMLALAARVSETPFARGRSVRGRR